MTFRPVKVVVVAYHQAEMLDACLESLGRLDVDVVDNSSAPDVRAAAERHGASYIDPGQNLGFGAAVNIVLRSLIAGEPADLLLVNPDAEISMEAVDGLARHLHSPRNERVAAVSAQLLNPEGVEERVAWPFPTPTRAWFEAVGLGRVVARSEYVVGAVLMLRWEALLEIGPFDERFFLYAEDADWQRQALGLGWRSSVCPDVTATHIGAGTSDDPGRREALFYAAHETYIRKWHGRSGWLTYRSAACLGAAARAVVLSGERRGTAARRARIYLRGPRRHAGLLTD